jgi:hypothetical protein
MLQLDCSDLSLSYAWIDQQEDWAVRRTKLHGSKSRSDCYCDVSWWWTASGGITGRAEIMDAPGPGGLGGRFGVIPCAALEPWRCLRSLPKGSYWLAPARSESSFNGTLSPGNGSRRLPGICAEWAPRKRWSLSMPMDRLTRRRRRRCSSIVCITGCWYRLPGRITTSSDC